MSYVWEQRKLGELASIYDGVHKTPNYKDSGIMFLSVENIITLKSKKYISEEDFERDYKVHPERGDIFMTRIGDVGTTNVVESSEKLAFYVSLALLKPIDSYPYFLSNAMKTNDFQMKLRKRTLVTAIPQKINKDEIGKLELFITYNFVEQKKIGDYFRKLDQLITLHQRKILLYKYFLTIVWEQRKLGEICETFEYGLNVAAKEYDGEHKYLRITDIDDSSHAFLQDNLTSPNVDFANSENYKLKYGDVLFARTGASVGKTYIYEDFDGLVYYAGFLIRGRVKSDYSPKFIFQNTLTDEYDRFIRITSQRSGQPGINALEYSRYQILVPTLAEQARIGEYFSNLDRLITLHRCKCIFYRKNMVNAWEQRKFSDLVQIERGGSPRPIDDYITDSPQGLNWVKIGDAPTQGNYITKTAEKIRPEGLSKTREVHPGDLILSNSMSFGKPYIMGIDGCIHDGWLLIRNTYNIFDLTFLCHLLATPQMLKQYKSFASGSTVNNLNKEVVGNTNVTIPDIDEQRVLGQYFEQLDNLITLHQWKCIVCTKIKVNTWIQCKFIKIGVKLQKCILLSIILLFKRRKVSCVFYVNILLRFIKVIELEVELVFVIIDGTIIVMFYLKIRCLYLNIFIFKINK